MIEICVVLAIVLILTCMAAPSFVQMQNAAAKSSAKKRLELIWQAEGNYAVCIATTPTECGGLQAILPTAGSYVQAGMYTFNLAVNGSTWTYTATPLNQQMLPVIVMTSQGAMSCTMHGIGVAC